MSNLGELGCGGRAPKTSAGYNNSIFQFNKFVDNTKILVEVSALTSFLYILKTAQQKTMQMNKFTDNLLFIWAKMP